MRRQFCDFLKFWKNWLKSSLSDYSFINLVNWSKFSCHFDFFGSWWIKTLDTYLKNWVFLDTQLFYLLGEEWVEVTWNIIIINSIDENNVINSILAHFFQDFKSITKLRKHCHFEWFIEPVITKIFLRHLMMNDEQYLHTDRKTKSLTEFCQFSDNFFDFCE